MHRDLLSGLQARPHGSDHVRTPDQPLSIAIDGPAGSGKSTLARGLAQRFGLVHIETGAMYRALALKAVSSGTPLDDPDALKGLLASTDIRLDGDRVMLDGRDVAGRIRSREVSSAASQVAEDPGVRAWCVERQREMAKLHRKGAVMEGRDIGTVVLPDAPIKVFLTADLEERASRRALERGGEGSESLEKVRSRDQRDTQRKTSPLVAADDAVVIDTTEHSAKQILDQVIRLVEEEASFRRSGSGGAET